MADTRNDEPMFTIPLPGGRVARVPIAVLEKYVDSTGRAAHAEQPPTPSEGGKTSQTNKQAGEPNMITINIYAGSGEVAICQKGQVDGELDHDDDDVVAHSLSVDAATGTSDFHTDWEHGECEYTDEAGFLQRLLAWHRHPFGTEYSELYEG